MSRHIETFNYPEDEELFLAIKDTTHLRDLLRSEHARLAIRLLYFQITTVRKTYIYAICKKCDAKLKYRKEANEETYRLMYFKNQHRHAFKRDENRVVENYIRDLP